MRIIDLIRRAYRSLKSAKVRTLLTSMAIAVGGFTLTITLAAGTGANRYADKLVESNFDPAELIVAKDEQLFGNEQSDKPREYDDTIGTEGAFQIRRLTTDDINKIASVEGVEKVRENFEINVQYITRKDESIKLIASLENYNPAQKPELAYGSTPQNDDLAQGEVLVPSDYVDALGFDSYEDTVGRILLVSIQRPFGTVVPDNTEVNEDAQQSDHAPMIESKIEEFRIVGITKKSPTTLGFGTLPILTSSSDARRLNDYVTEGTNNYRRYTVVYAKVGNGEDPNVRDAVQQELEGLGYNVQSVADTQQFITRLVGILQAIVLVFGLIALVASVFGVINTQYISVLERTREIGLMKALGMRKKDISRLFIIEATWIGFIGGLIGTLSGLAIGTLFNPYISDRLDLGPGNNLLVFSAGQMLILVLLLMTVTTLAGILPAKKAAKLNPIEALRTE